MASKRTKSDALVQIHMNEEDFTKLNHICLAEGVNKTDMVKTLIRDYYNLLNNGFKRESYKEEKEEQEMDKITYEPRKDCFAYQEHSFDKSKRNCKCLTEMICVNRGKCPFYKKKGDKRC